MTYGSDGAFNEGRVVRSECLTDCMLSDARRVIREHKDRWEIEDDVYYLSTNFRRSLGLGSELNLIIPNVRRENLDILFFVKMDIERNATTAEVNDLEGWEQTLESTCFDVLNENLLAARNGQPSGVLMLEPLTPVT